MKREFEQTFQNEIIYTYIYIFQSYSSKCILRFSLNLQVPAQKITATAPSKPKTSSISSPQYLMQISKAPSSGSETVTSHRTEQIKQKKTQPRSIITQLLSKLLSKLPPFSLRYLPRQVNFQLISTHLLKRRLTRFSFPSS